MQPKKLKWKSDFDKSVIIENFVNRGISNLDYNIYVCRLDQGIRQRRRLQ